MAKPTIAAAGHGRPSLESIAQDLLRVKDFSYPGLCSLASDFPTKVSKRRKSRPDSETTKSLSSGLLTASGIL